MLDTLELRFRRRAYCPLIEGFEMVSEKDWHIHFGRYQRAQKRRRLLRQLRLPVLAAGAGFGLAWGWTSCGPIRFSSMPEMGKWTGSSPVFYRNCAAARAAGAAPLYRGQSGYASHLDRDNDGIACEPYPRW
jgi:hypothetical protein